MGRIKLTTEAKQSTGLSTVTKLTLSAGIAGLILWAGILGTMEGLTNDDWDNDGVADIYDLDDDNDGIPDDLECSGLTITGPVSVLNGGFEEPDEDAATPIPVKGWGSGQRAVLFEEADVQGWETTATDNKIEVWESGFGGITAYEGEQFAEINATQHAALFQDLSTTPGVVMTWSFAHRGRKSNTVADSMRLLIGPPGGTMVEVGRFGTTKAAWQLYSGTYTVPTGQATTRFSYESVSTASGSNSVGNLLDAIRFYASDVNCPVDSDNDADPNCTDLDSDGDRIYDIIEAGGDDLDGDGMVDDPTDVDGDGLADVYDADPTDGPLVSGCTLGVDCDLSGSTSTLFDTDFDGINNKDGDFDKDAIPNWADIDSDGDGLTDSTETTLDKEGDGNPNFLDLDSDGDGIVDNVEAQGTDTYLSISGIDSDADGLDDAYDNSNAFGGAGITPENVDADSLADYLDLDSDNDKKSDALEAHDSDKDGSPDTGSPSKNGTPSGVDQDADGLDDGYDNDVHAISPNNNNLAPSSFPKNSSNTVPAWRSVGGQFPVEWLSFEAAYEQQAVSLSWATASELNSDYFEVQRSLDGIAFTNLGNVQAAGNTQEIQNYTFDDKALQGISDQKVVYRLRQVDFDGAFEFSKVVEVYVGGSEQRLSLTAFPNPTTGPVSVAWSSGSPSGSATWSVLNINGSTLQQGEVDLSSQTMKLDLSGLPAGTYIIHMAQEEDVQSVRIIKR